MTADARFDRDLAAVLEDLYLGPSPDYRAEALAAATHHRQRPSWTFAGRWLPMADITAASPVTTASRWRTVAVSLLIIALLVAALALVAGSRQTKLPPPFGPARNGEIVYPSNGDVMALDPVTGKTKELVIGRSNDLDALYSPDGTHIAFSRLSENEDPVMLNILVANADGSHPTTITPTPLRADGLRFEWAPDSRSLYVQTGLFNTGPLEILILDATKAAAPRLLATNAQLFAAAARPPDGKQLLIRRTQGYWHQLVALDVETGDDHVLAEGSQDAIRSARWSNSGRQVVYAMTESDNRASVRLWIVDADGSNPHQVTFADGVWAHEDPAWSPDDKQIAFTRWEQTSSSDPVTWVVRQIGVLDVASGNVTGVGPLPREVRKDHPTGHDASATPTERFAFAWSPDGKWLLAVPSEATGHPVLIDPSTNTWTVLDALFDEQGGAAQLWQRTAD
jgi:Tol biopolymer transport system component